MHAANYPAQSVSPEFAFVRTGEAIPDFDTRTRQRAGYAGKADFVTARHRTGGVTG